LNGLVLPPLSGSRCDGLTIGDLDMATELLRCERRLQISDQVLAILPRIMHFNL
jgi:hypothetical protein